MIIGIFIIIEVIAMAVIGISHLNKLNGFAERRVELKQSKVETIGRILALLGTVLVLLSPQMFNVQRNYSARGGLISFFATAVGFCIFIIGLRLRIIAYKPEAETPKWIRKIVSFWK